MARYSYEQLEYNKRPLTQDAALYVITDRVPDKGDKDYAEQALPYKAGELAAQQDSCPVQDLGHIRERVGYLKGRYPGFRIRNAQFSAVPATAKVIRELDGETADYLIAAGTTAVIAAGYENGTDLLLLEKGILPLRSENAPSTGTFILIKDISDGLSGGRLNAFSVTAEDQTELDISLGNYSDEQLRAVIK
ncbi:MAG: hypothetical protein IJ806_09295 [Ruminococcus sp.]|nr:hypothetical protein [Ruminococcus sp.]